MEHGGMVWEGKNCSTGRKTCSSATLFITNPTPVQAWILFHFLLFLVGLCYVWISKVLPLTLMIMYLRRWIKACARYDVVGKSRRLRPFLTTVLTATDQFSFRFVLSKRLPGMQSWPESFAEKRNLLPLLGTEVGVATGYGLDGAGFGPTHPQLAPRIKKE